MGIGYGCCSLVEHWSVCVTEQPSNCFIIQSIVNCDFQQQTLKIVFYLLCLPNMLSFSLALSVLSQYALVASKLCKLTICDSPMKRFKHLKMGVAMSFKFLPSKEKRSLVYDVFWCSCQWVCPRSGYSHTLHPERSDTSTTLKHNSWYDT